MKVKLTVTSTLQKFAVKQINNPKSVKAGKDEIIIHDDVVNG